MNFEYSAADQAFRDEVRQWMQDNLPKGPRGTSAGFRADKEFQFIWEKKLAEKGWLTFGWPKEYGGPGWTATQRDIFETERARAGAPGTSPFGLMMLAPVLMKFGSAEQKEYYLPRIAKVEDIWCQGYSEPGSGSDLASLKMQALRQGDKYIVNGQKIWTTQAHWANMIFCLVRTSNEGAKQKGISFLLIDMKSKGVEVRPIVTIDGHHHLNEVFFTDVEVPVKNLVGEEGQGWSIAKYLLTHERTGIASVADNKAQLAKLKDVLSRDPGLKDDPHAKRRVTELEVDLMALEYTNLRMLSRMDQGESPGPGSSSLKVKGTELQQAITEAHVEFGAHDAMPWHVKVEGVEPAYQSATGRYNYLRAATIYGGSNEIQKNVLAKILIGL